MNDFEREMIEVFRPMKEATDRIRAAHLGLGMGDVLHDSARAVAPAWLRAWDDDRRWIICFRDGWDNLLIMARAFGLDKQELLDDLFWYKERENLLATGP